ncbi:hypothetical protein KR222_003740, partial [Zaprionus bogoriensis]
MSRCPRCDCEATGQNRLVTDSCGHNKCRLCLLADVADCLECKAAVEVEQRCNEATQQPEPDPDAELEAVATGCTASHITSTAAGYHCGVCNKSFRSRTQQYYHRACGNELLKRFPCTQCSRRFATRSHLKYHLNSHVKESSFCCTLCGKSFQQELILRHHMQRVHKPKSYACPQCQRVFRTQSALTTHQLVHSGSSLPYKCDACSKCYLTKANLKQHQLKHDQNSMQHSCPVCNKSFHRRSTLKLHQKRHATRSRHACPHCHKTLNDVDALARHIKQHTATQRYRCRQCDVTVSRRDNMVRHLRSMHIGVHFDTGVEVIEQPEPEDELPSAPAESTGQTVRYNSVIKSVGNVQPIREPAVELALETAVAPPAASLPDKMQKENVKLYRKILDLDTEEYSNEPGSALDLDLDIVQASDVQQVTLQERHEQPQRVPGHASSNFSERHWRKSYKNFYENEHTNQ